MTFKFYTYFFLTILSYTYSIDSQAQNKVTLNINLKPVQTLVINNTQTEVTLNYLTKDDYQNGVSATQNDHLTIYSTSGFQVKVSGNSQTISSSSLPINSLSVAPSSGSAPIPSQHVIYQENQLDVLEKPIITSNIGGINKNFNIAYHGANANQYINDYKINAVNNTHVYEITYTIISQ